MRKTIIGLLISLLVLLVYIASCGPNQADKSSESATANKARIVAATATEAVAPKQQSLATPAVKPALTPPKPASANNVQRAEAALRASGFHGVNVQEVDGSLLLRGNVDSPSDRVRAGRSLAQLGMPVINHVRAKQGNTAKPLALTIEKRNGAVSLRGDMTPAMHQSLKQRFSLVGNSGVNEMSISTPNASGVVQLAASAIDRLNNGSVRITDTRVVVNGESSGDAQVFRMGLNRGLPRGFSLTTNVQTGAVVEQQANPAAAAIPVASTVAVAEPVPVKPGPVTQTSDSNVSQFFNKPAVVKPVSPTRYQTATVNSAESDYPIAKTYPLEPGDPSYRAVSGYGVTATVNAVAETRSQEPATPAYRSVSRYEDSASTYPIAETYPIESVEPTYRSESRYSNAVYSTAYESEVSVESNPNIINYAEPIAQPVVLNSNVENTAANTGSINASCDSPDLNLMPDGSIRFFHNSAQLTHKARQRMELALGALRRCPQLKVEVAGHTDVTGADYTNGDISRARAERIALYLRTNGVAESRLRVASYGDSQPAFSNDSKFGRAMNRRVDLLIRR